MTDKIRTELAKVPWADVAYYTMVIILIAIIIFSLVKIFGTENLSQFTSQIDNKSYAIRNSGTETDKQIAANYLAALTSKVDKLVIYMKNNQLPNQVIADRLYHRWSNCVLKETSSTDKSVAFTVNKSSEMRICIRSINSQFEDPNTAMFVILHELAHVMSVSYGHNEEFKNNFAYITKLASQLGIYTPEDFTRVPKSYCGTIISSTPCSNEQCV